MWHDAPELRARRRQGRDGQRDGNERAGRDHVWDELLWDLRWRDRGDTDRHASHRLYVQRLERRRLHGHGTLYRDLERYHHSHRDVWRADVRAHGDQSGSGQRDGNERAGGDHVWDELLWDLRWRDRG